MSARGIRVGGVRGGLVVILSVLLANSSNYGSYSKSLDNWKTHLKQVVKPKELQSCLEIIRLESNGNPKAKNGSHYGLVQGRSEYLKTATAVQQIDWFVKYLDHRYNGSCIVALRHHRAKGWY
jgi:hypothetical protein